MRGPIGWMSFGWYWTSSVFKLFGLPVNKELYAQVKRRLFLCLSVLQMNLGLCPGMRSSILPSRYTCVLQTWTLLVSSNYTVSAYIMVQISKRKAKPKKWTLKTERVFGYHLRAARTAVHSLDPSVTVGTTKITGRWCTGDGDVEVPWLLFIIIFPSNSSDSASVTVLSFLPLRA